MEIWCAGKIHTAQDINFVRMDITPLKEFEETFGVTFPRLIGEQTANNVEQTYFDSLMTIRKVLKIILTHEKAAEKIRLQRRLIF